VNTPTPHERIRVLSVPMVRFRMLMPEAQKNECSGQHTAKLNPSPHGGGNFLYKKMMAGPSFFYL